MIIEVDLTSSRPALRLSDGSDFGAFHVSASTRDGDSNWEALAVAVAAAGYVSSETVFLPVATIEALAGQQAKAEGWREGLTKMVSYAESKGWTDGDGAIAAHVEWGRAAADRRA